MKKSLWIVKRLFGECQREFTLALCPRFQKLSRYIASDLQRLGNRPPLSHKTWNVVRCGQVHALGEFFNVKFRHSLHPSSVRTIETEFLRRNSVSKTYRRAFFFCGCGFFLAAGWAA